MGEAAQRVCLFGGTFDPIHKAHLAVAEEACRSMALDEVLFVPAARPPHKPGAMQASYEHRLRMVELACSVHPRFVASRLEENTATSYSIDTIERVQAASQPGTRLFFLIGADAFAEIGTWHRWRDVLHSVEFIVVSRPGHVYDVPVGARVYRLDTLALPVSSTVLRAQLAMGERPADLPPAVLDYIVQQGLYGVV